MSDHEDCSFSTGICGSLTAGSGELDYNGYWEHPCFECARKAEADMPWFGPCWPFQWIDGEIFDPTSFVQDGAPVW